MPNPEEETYSIIFTTLKHPARRKILRILAEKPKNFSRILDELGISSSHLTLNTFLMASSDIGGENMVYRTPGIGYNQEYNDSCLSQIPVVV